MKKIIIIILLLVLTIAMLPYNSKAAKQGTGLEVESPKLFVHIADLSKDAKEFGLSKQLIRSKIELALRQNDIEVLNESSLFYPYTLYVEILFVGDKYSGGFGIALYFTRNIEYSSGGTNYKKYAPSYNQSMIGTSTDKDYIMNSLEDQVDIFINEFHRANNF
jgi:hypothetical protein